MDEAAPSITRRLARARLKLAIGTSAIDVPVSVPADPVGAGEVLPTIHKLQNELVSAAEQGAARQARAISCKAGCGACCRQPVPLADIEAYALLALIDRLPAARQAVIRQRFADARQRVEESGLADALRRMGEDGEDGPTLRAVANEYFRLGIPCPFLEEESCSIYAERPVPCRAYLVTSPAAFCTDVSSRDIKILPVLALSPAVQSLTSDPASPRRRWVVMTMLFEWRTRNSPSTERQAGPHWIGRLLRALRASA
jgi:Fe-S-cluster containining protein